MKSAGFFWFSGPQMKHEESESSEGEKPENPDGEAMQEPEARPRRSLFQMGAERIDPGGEEEP
jgi:hypothetical protein